MVMYTTDSVHVSICAGYLDLWIIWVKMQKNPPKKRYYIKGSACLCFVFFKGNRVYFYVQEMRCRLCRHLNSHMVALDPPSKICHLVTFKDWNCNYQIKKRGMLACVASFLLSSLPWASTVDKLWGSWLLIWCSVNPIKKHSSQLDSQLSEK